MIQVTPLRLLGIALVVLAVAYKREDAAAAVRSNAGALAYYSVLAAAAFVAGRQLAGVLGASPQEWLTTILDALTGVIPVV